MTGSAFTGYSRALDGCIVQFVSATGERRTVVRQGAPRDPRRGGHRLRRGDEGVLGSLQAAIAVMEAWPGEWKVEVISTPTTILTDMQGGRVRSWTLSRDSGRTRSDIAASQVQLPEVRYLARIGRSDLLAA